MRGRACRKPFGFVIKPLISRVERSLDKDGLHFVFSTTTISENGAPSDNSQRLETVKYRHNELQLRYCSSPKYSSGSVVYLEINDE